MSEQYPWMRVPGESSTAYAAFKVYMNQGVKRSLRGVGREMDGNKQSAINGWSTDNDWVARAAAFDSYLTTAEVDGITDQLTNVRNKHLDVASKVLDHLMGNAIRWKPGEDPSIRWTTAFTAVTKLQHAALTLRDTGANADTELVDKIMKALAERAEG